MRFAAVAACLLLTVSVAIAVNHRYSTATPVAARPVADVLVIGDSWADGLAQAIAQHGLDVRSLGFPGERSGKIYEDFAAAPDTAKFCIITAGVNDAIGHFGANYYAHHLRLIASLAMQRGCIPVLIALPRFDQLNAQARMPAYIRLRNMLYRYLFDLHDFFPVDAYRAAAQRELPNATFINPDDAVGSFESRPEMWSEPQHLSLAGRAALARAVIASLEPEMSNSQPKASGSW